MADEPSQSGPVSKSKKSWSLKLNFKNKLRRECSHENKNTDFEKADDTYKILRTSMMIRRKSVLDNEQSIVSSRKRLMRACSCSQARFFFEQNILPYSGFVKNVVTGLLINRSLKTSSNFG